MLVAAVLAAAPSAGCVAPSPADVDGTREAVYFGEAENDEHGVVRIVAVRGGGSSCSASVVGSTVLMTANHCVDGTEPGDWIVQQGRLALTNPELWVTDIITPGPFYDDSDDDIALLVLGSPIDAPIYTPAYDLDEHTLYSEAKIVGYGLDEHGGSGTRSSAYMGIVFIGGLTLRLAGEAYPGSGDSGGAAIDERGHVVGVISRGGPRIGIMTRVDAHRWLLDPVLRANGGCVPGDPELCDRVDNDCDMEIDEGCIFPGDECETADRCTTGHCEEVDGRRICTEPCDAALSESCWPGAYCREDACGEGICRPGEPGELDHGAPCDDDLDCASLLCRDPGDGQGRCATRCTPDALGCASAEACALVDGDCAACFDASLVSSRHGLGEPCADDGDCHSGLSCLSDPPELYCSSSCETHGGCPEAMHCREGRCVMGELGEVGYPCVSNDDCESELCWTTPEGLRLCAAPCGERRTWCPMGASCDYDLGVCVTEDTPIGGACEPGETVCTAGACATIGGETLCAPSCAPRCPTGMECRTTDDDGRVCWPLPAPDPDSGCACTAARPRGATPMARLAARALPGIAAIRR